MDPEWSIGLGRVDRLSPTGLFVLILSCAISLSLPFFLRKRSKGPCADFRHIDIQKRPGILSSWYTSRATAAADFAINGPRLVRDAYRADKTLPSYITSIHRMVLPPSTLQELAALSADVASLRENFVDRYVGKWTGFDIILETSLFSDVVRVGLTQNLGKS